MSDHISGPRALSDPIADITDVYAFPSPERPGHLVLVMNTLPFAKPWDALSDGLIYRFRLRSLAPGEAGDPAPFAALDDELVFDCVFTPHVHPNGPRTFDQEGTLTTPAGHTVGIAQADQGRCPGLRRLPVRRGTLRRAARRLRPPARVDRQRHRVPHRGWVPLPRL